MYLSMDKPFLAFFFWFWGAGGGNEARNFNFLKRKVEIEGLCILRIGLQNAKVKSSLHVSIVFQHLCLFLFFLSFFLLLLLFIFIKIFFFCAIYD